MRKSPDKEILNEKSLTTAKTPRNTRPLNPEICHQCPTSVVDCRDHSQKVLKVLLSFGLPRGATSANQNDKIPAILFYKFLVILRNSNFFTQILRFKNKSSVKLR